MCHCRNQIVELLPLEGDKYLCFRGFGFYQRIGLLIQAQVIGKIIRMNICIGVDFGAQPQVAGMEFPYDA